jgi:Trk-type K+ transport system membrane component
MSSRLAVVALVGRVVVLFSLLMCVPLGFAAWHDDAAQMAFGESIAFSVLLGVAMALTTRQIRNELQLHDGFILVALTWIVLPGIGSLPLWLAIPGPSFTDAYFEAMSGFTTTGATCWSTSTRCRCRSTCGAASCPSSAAWASSCSPWRSCHCSAWAARRCSRQSPPAR